MNNDMAQYLDVFFEESKEHLMILNERLLELEKNPEDLSSLNEIFRSAHTLKGMSATMGFDDMAELTHHMEDVLSDLKEGIMRVNSKVVDILFNCLDRLQMMVDNIQKGLSPSMDNTALMEQLEEVKTGKFTNEVNASDISSQGSKETVEQQGGDELPSAIASSFELNDYEMTVIREVQGRDLFAHHIVVRVAEDCLMKSVRVFMVFKALEAEGEIIKSVPPAEELDEGKFGSEFHLIFVSNLEDEEISNLINSISEVEVAAVVKMSEEMCDVELEEEKAVSENEVVVEKAAPTGQVEDAIKTHKVKQTVRVDIERLDNLMNLVGELVINKGRLEQIGSTQFHTDLDDVVEQIERVTNDLQNVVMKVRMVPIEQVFNRFPRMVRDLAKDLGKDVEFIIEGKDTELDRTVIDEIGDPLVHLLRNAVDHGIEPGAKRQAEGKPLTGTVRLVARHEGNNVFIEVMDDGGGLSLESIRRTALNRGLASQQELDTMTEDEVLQFVFMSGFSTAQNVTDVSGRGVGLDVVRTKIESLNGEIHVDTKKGQGTTFRIRLPLTLAIIQALLVRVGDETYAIPLSSVDETTMMTSEDIKMVQMQEVVVLRGKVLPLARARRLLETPGAAEDDQVLYIVIVRKGERQIGLAVDALIGQQEIVIKSLGRLMGGIPGIAGATILGDGGVSLILDVGTLV